MRNIASRTTSGAGFAAESPRRVNTEGAATAGDAAAADWQQVGIFGAGIVLGALIGAGAALLLAPATGFETRMRLAQGARRARGRASERFDELGDRVRDNARRSRRKLERKLVMSRWRAQDAWERKRRGED